MDVTCQICLSKKPEEKTCTRSLIKSHKKYLASIRGIKPCMSHIQDYKQCFPPYICS
ncbi:hypothetical protein E2C01_063127 [Portunus trituberculatus]|uniref:Uncharacterized protein n=1 Tax=Portunus trituberculatus TaxID=210409 RepID=A0A5B7HG28_PORTR|nr:hypothetical protein [Portunus trituberculatus]